jgi:hypothetical protein
MSVAVVTRPSVPTACSFRPTICTWQCGSRYRRPASASVAAITSVILGIMCHQPGQQRLPQPLALRRGERAGTGEHLDGHHGRFSFTGTRFSSSSTDHWS